MFSISFYILEISIVKRIKGTCHSVFGIKKNLGSIIIHFQHLSQHGNLSESPWNVCLQNFLLNFV